LGILPACTAFSKNFDQSFDDSIVVTGSKDPYAGAYPAGSRSSSMMVAWRASLRTVAVSIFFRRQGLFRLT
jgi:hypothetical protein